MSWDNLSFREKAEVIKVGVKNGLRNIDSIRSNYNSFDDSYSSIQHSEGGLNKFGDGGDTNPIKTIDDFDVKVVGNIPFTERNDLSDYVAKNTATLSDLRNNEFLKSYQSDYLDRLGKRHSHEVVKQVNRL